MMASDSSDCCILSALVSDELLNAMLYGKEGKKTSVCVCGERKAASSALSHPTALVYFFLQCKLKSKAKESFKTNAFIPNFSDPRTFKTHLAES